MDELIQQVKHKQQMSTKPLMSSPAVPVSDCEVRDPRIRRTRQLLQGALWSLLKTKGFDEISVQDIADTATVNRATFYDHYTDKYGLLEASVGASFHALLQERKVAYDASCAAGASALILATCEFLVQTHANEGECRRQSAFQPLIDAAVVAAIRRVLAAGATADAESPQPGGARPPGALGRRSRADTGLAVTAASWAIYGAVKEWFSRPSRPPADELIPMVLEWVMPMLHDLNRRRAAT
jgi:AcrR family transcriptional regulator